MNDDNRVRNREVQQTGDRMRSSDVICVNTRTLAGLVLCRGMVHFCLAALLIGTALDRPRAYPLIGAFFIVDGLLNIGLCAQLAKRCEAMAWLCVVDGTSRFIFGVQIIALSDQIAALLLIVVLAGCLALILLAVGTSTTVLAMVQLLVKSSRPKLLLLFLFVSGAATIYLALAATFSTSGAQLLASLQSYGLANGIALTGLAASLRPNPKFRTVRPS